ncbi:CapA family protein [Haloferula sp. A504]|uniref:CapA family protein n=1 Tax=Haloferula sp. A504 TaxID=3373601 RepID=UPI0031CA37F8|nr:CapA family protein [Verrucomicrobiaceae bacterium E54]
MRAVGVLLLLGVMTGTVMPREALPVFLADNHAENFGWISRTFDLDAEHVLVLTDAHSDASAVERSGEIRERLRRVASEDERAERIEAWRSGGRIQAYNWIEPLMPRPFGQVLWVAPGGDLRAMLADARRACDGRLEVEPRSAGTLGERWRVTDLAAMESWKPGMRPVVWSLDLDFFAEMDAMEAAASFERMWVAAMDWPGLCGVGVSVSRPWLESDAQADRLVAMLLSAVSRTRGAVLEIDASIDDRPDDSLHSRRGSVKRWDLAAASPEVKGWIGRLGSRCGVLDRVRRHAFPALPVRLEVEGLETDLDGVWRIPPDLVPVLRLRGAEGSGRVRWRELRPARKAYDLLPETGLGKGFSGGAGRWIYERPVPLATTEDFALSWKPWLASKSRIRIEASYEKDGHWLPAGVIEMRFQHGAGFRGALSETMGMPYVFGIAGVEEDDLTGVESGWGADCSNVLVHAWRRCGVPMEWGDPGRLRRQLVEWSGRLAPEAIERGVMIDFGSHVAALFEDREPWGWIGPEDRVFHHLGGWAEITTVAALQEGRPPFRVWVLPEREEVVVRVAGDVVPVGDVAAVAGFEKGGADLFVANLEGVPTRLPAVGAARHDFRFPPERLGWLRERGVDAVSLANNHAGDAGSEGLVDGLAELRKAGIGVFGAGRDAAEACRPWVSEGVACFGVSLVPSMAAGDGPGVAAVPRHARLIEHEIAAARARGESVVVLVHGGDEYRREVNDDQRRWARWLVARGARLLAGSGPHVVQREEAHGGAVVVHSLGNAVFPKKLKGADGGRIGEWTVPGTPRTPE